MTAGRDRSLTFRALLAGREFRALWSGNAASVAAGMARSLAPAALGMAAGDLAVGRFVGPATRSRITGPLYVLLAAPYLAFAANPSTWVAVALVGWHRPGSAVPSASASGL
jgi:hypothetical protein